MTDLSSKVALVRDGGFFVGLARRLAQDYGKVYYCPHYRQNNPSLHEGIVGDGFGDIVYCSDLWLVKEEVDTFVFPDIGFMGEQQELTSQGRDVWGARAGMRLETNREFFLQTLKALGLDVAPHKIVVGITALREFLKDKEDLFIKLSKWRATWETYHWRSWNQDAHRLDVWAVKFGGVREKIRFLCFDKIDTVLEIGGDTYNVFGEWPETMLHGIEAKDSAYFSAVTKRKNMPEELTLIMDAFSPVLRATNYCAQWSMEVRVAKEGNFFIDATARGGLPSTASFLAAKNTSQIIFHGAKGEMVPIDYGYQFSAECMVKIRGEDGAWDTIVLPEELKSALVLSDCCESDGQPWFPADDKPIEEIGWLRATGNTPTEVAEEMNRLADLLPDGADAAVESLADILREIEAEHEQGIKFTDQPLPDPEIVLEPST